MENSTNNTKRSELIAKQNDEFRKQIGIPVFGSPKIQGKTVMTAGITGLTPVEQIEVVAKVRDFADFSEDNDPYGEHDFGAFEHNGQRIFWKIDYYANDLQWGSENPSDPKQTMRVLTIMFASEY